MRGQQPGAPHLEDPDEIEVSEGESCFLDRVRVCGPDCIAFNTDQVDAHGSPVQGVSKCTIIILLGQVGSGLGALVQLKVKQHRAQQTPAAPQPPKVG